MSYYRRRRPSRRVYKGYYDDPYYLQHSHERGAGGFSSRKTVGAMTNRAKTFASNAFNKARTYAGSKAHKYIDKLKLPSGKTIYAYPGQMIKNGRVVLVNAANRLGSRIGITQRNAYKQSLNTGNSRWGGAQRDHGRSYGAKQAYDRTPLGRAENFAKSLGKKVGDVTDSARARGESVVNSAKQLYSDAKRRGKQLYGDARRATYNAKVRGSRLLNKAGKVIRDATGINDYKRYKSAQRIANKTGDKAYADRAKSRYDQSLLGRAENTYKKARTAGKQAFNNATEYARSIPGKASSAAKNASDRVKNIPNDMFRTNYKARKNFNETAKKVKNSSLYKKASGVADSVGRNVSGTVNRAENAIKNTVAYKKGKSAWNAASGAIKNSPVYRTAAGAARTVGGAVKNAGNTVKNSPVGKAVGKAGSTVKSAGLTSQVQTMFASGIPYAQIARKLGISVDEAIKRGKGKWRG